MTPPNPRRIPTAIVRFTRSLKTKWERRPTRIGWEVTRMTELATGTATPAAFREAIHRVKCVARIAPTPAIRSASRREVARSRARSRTTNGRRIAVANARRYSAIVT